MILKLEDIYYRYNKHSPYILNGISYEFDKGNIYAIMGGSGSGKTTLISVIAALDKPASGKIYYNGTDISTLDADVYRAKKVSVIFQNYNLLNAYTAIDNIAVILHLSGYKGNYISKAAELLHEVGIPAEKHNCTAQHFSGGEQQRIAIARTLASHADIILADEPTGNLDTANQENILRIFENLTRKYNKCVIIVTHSQSVASSADYLLRLDAGKMI